MGLRLFILSLAVFSCAVPPALGLHLLKAAAVVGAVKGAALLGGDDLAVKGAAIKGAAIGAVKGAVAKGAAILAAKGAVVKGAVALAAKAASLMLHKLPTVQVQPVLIEEPGIVQYSFPTVVPANVVSFKKSPPRLPSILNSLTALWSEAHHRHHFKEPVVYEYALPPPLYPAPAPMLERIDDDHIYNY